MVIGNLHAQAVASGNQLLSEHVGDFIQTDLWSGWARGVARAFLVSFPDPQFCVYWGSGNETRAFLDCYSALTMTLVIITYKGGRICVSSCSGVCLWLSRCHWPNIPGLEKPKVMEVWRTGTPIGTVVAGVLCFCILPTCSCSSTTESALWEILSKGVVERLI